MIKISQRFSRISEFLTDWPRLEAANIIKWYDIQNIPKENDYLYIEIERKSIIMHKNVLAETIRINIHILIFFLCDLYKGYQEEWKRGVPGHWPEYQPGSWQRDGLPGTVPSSGGRLVQLSPQSGLVTRDSQHNILENYHQLSHWLIVITNMSNQEFARWVSESEWVRVVLSC